MNKKAKCAICGKQQTIDEIRLCSQKEHLSNEKVETKPSTKGKVHSFSTVEERDDFVAKHPGSRILTTKVKRSSIWSEEEAKYVSVVTETYAAISA